MIIGFPSESMHSAKPVTLGGNEIVTVEMYSFSGPIFSAKSVRVYKDGLLQES